MSNSTPPQKHTRHHARTRGVLIVEMLAAFAIVSVTLVIVADSFISANKGNASTHRSVEVADALAYVLADMTREARVSHQFAWNASTYTFSMTRVEDLNEQTADDVSYRLESDDRIWKTVNTLDLPITPTLLDVVSFAVVEHTTSDVRRVSVSMEVTHGSARQGEPPVYIHTTLAERFY